MPLPRDWSSTFEARLDGGDADESRSGELQILRPETPTAKPPIGSKQFAADAFHGLTSTVPPSSLTPLDEAFVMPERVFFDRLEHRARRAELLSALLQAKGLSPERGVRALQAALGAIVASAEETHLPSLASLARGLQSAIGHLGVGGAPNVDDHSRDVLVLDETEVSRDLVALAVEAQGHIVRCASSYDEFVRQLDERLPDLIITEIELANAPPRHFCDGLVELLASRRVPVVFFSAVDETLLTELAKRANARIAIHKGQGLDGLMNELERVFAAG